jgi:hypothetical protein
MATNASRIADQRQGDRYQVGVKRASVRKHGALALDAALEDISIYGCRLISAGEHVVGERLWLRFVGKPAIAATLVWAEGGTIGCRFDAPIESALVRSLTLRLV